MFSWFRKTESFTLVELLIVIAILAVLAAAVVIVLNPAELLAQARDSQRITDLKTLKDSIDIWVVDNPSVSMGTSQTVYISIPDTSVTCANISALPTLPAGWTYHCVTEANLRNTDGTGWVPLNLSSVYGGSPIPYLPLDPTNTASTGRYYTYVMGGSYELTALMEAEKENASVQDGGSLPGVYQLGNHIDLTPPTRDKGLVGYWTFDEGSGTTAYDSSGKGNDGIWNGLSAHYVAGRVGAYAATFDDTSNYINCGSDSSLDMNRELTVSFWIRGEPENIQWATIFNKRNENIGWGMQVSSYGPATYIRLDTSAGTNQTSGGLTTLDNTWHHAVYVIDNGNKRYYLDGLQVYTGTYNEGNGFSYAAQWLRVGGAFRGQMDDVRLYDRALSTQEVSAIYESTR
jgi:prepilin-type N-terminal cleavage/methylation domain-containing protein